MQGGVSKFNLISYSLYGSDVKFVQL